MKYDLHRIPSIKDGYYIVRAPDNYPGAKMASMYAYEHRVIWWLYYGSLPDSDYHIHHINHDKKDNRIENLEVIHRKNHSKEKHNGGKEPQQFIELECAYCKSKFTQKESSVNYRKSLGQVAFYCTKSCQVTIENSKKKGTKTNYPKNRKRTVIKKGVNLICKVCQKEYYVCAYKQFTSKTCSKACSNLLKTCAFK